MTLTDLEAKMAEVGAMGVNIHAGPDGFRMHIRLRGSDSFRCAQQAWPSIDAAASEHFPAAPDILGDLL